MTTTTLQDFNPTIARDGGKPVAHTNELTGRYDELIEQQRLSWTTHQKLIRLLGKGGQGVVYLSERRGADGFTLPIALKVFFTSSLRDRVGLRDGDGADGPPFQHESLRSNKTTLSTYTTLLTATESACCRWSGWTALTCVAFFPMTSWDRFSSASVDGGGST